MLLVFTYTNIIKVLEKKMEKSINIKKLGNFYFIIKPWRSNKWTKVRGLNIILMLLILMLEKINDATVNFVFKSWKSKL